MQRWLSFGIKEEAPTRMIIGEKIQIDDSTAAFRTQHGGVHVQPAFGDDI
jgi:hypothetical protein